MKRTAQCLVMGCLLTACAASDPQAATPPSLAAEQAGSRPVALLNGGPVHWDSLKTPMVEAAGGQILQEIVLGRLLQEELSRRGLTISKQQIDRERQLLVDTLDPDRDQAARLLAAVRKRRGLGAERFEALLWRNAALRMLVEGEAQVTEADLRQAYEEGYGLLYVVRLVTVNTMEQAAEVVRRARAGESFIDLAVELSTDSSAKQGGLLPAISPADATYPQALRAVLPKLQAGEVSDPIALETGFAVVRLERLIEPVPVEFEEVKAELTQRVRRRVEQEQMQRKARQLLNQAEVLVLDPTLAEAWRQQRQQEEQQP